jgi:NAD(P)H-hydrate epimerase
MRLPARLLRRRPESNKGDFGHVFILAGSARFSGAAVLSAAAAMRSGAGLVTLGLPASLNKPIIRIKPKEVMTLPLPETTEGTLSLSGLKKIKDFIRFIDVLAVGPGLTRNRSTQALVRGLLPVADKPAVIDADGLNALVGYLDFLRAARNARRATIITPHPGEMARLLDTAVRQVQSDRKGVAARFSREYRVTVVLKGHRTVVADLGRTYINMTGNPGMATAGSGDVLTGMIAAFLGQGMDAFSAAKYAVYLHGLAGDLAAKKKTQPGMIASDIVEMIPEAIKKSS